MTDNRETIAMLKVLKEQALKSHNDTAVLKVTIDSFNFVIDKAIKALEQEPCEDWYDVPSDEMILEQARQAVKDLRKKLAEDLINQKATTCRHGGHCEWAACDKCNHYEPDALSQQPCEDCVSRNNKRTICTDGLEEGIRCAMCTNPMANDRGCDGGCVVNESMYQNVLNVIKKQILEQEPCEDVISRQAVLDIIMPYCQDDDGSVENTGDLRNALDDIEALPPVTPKEKTGKWIYKQGIFGAVYCSKCDFELKTNNTKYCPNCGARMVIE